MTLLLDRKSAGDYEEASGSDLLLQLLAAARLILRRPRKCLPTTRRITPPAVVEGGKGKNAKCLKNVRKSTSLNLRSDLLF